VAGQPSGGLVEKLMGPAPAVRGAAQEIGKLVGSEPEEVLPGDPGAYPSGGQFRYPNQKGFRVWSLW